jgi:predicted SprT family Zn-dependent metalloprotease
MAETHHRTCKCGAVYNRSESMAPNREISSFDCTVCGTTMETWNTAWVPSYRLIVGPIRLPES